MPPPRTHLIFQLPILQRMTLRLRTDCSWHLDLKAAWSLAKACLNLEGMFLSVCIMARKLPGLFCQKLALSVSLELLHGCLPRPSAPKHPCPPNCLILFVGSESSLSPIERTRCCLDHSERESGGHAQYIIKQMNMLPQHTALRLALLEILALATLDRP